MRKSVFPLLLSGLAALVVAPTIDARTLLPSEALGAASRLMPAPVGPAAAASRAEQPVMALAFTQPLTESTEPGVYVFAATGGQGFMVVAADDAVGADRLLLGYADTGSFNPADIPPAMAWWLEAWAEQIRQTAESGSPLPVAEQRPSPRPGEAVGVAPAASMMREPVLPLVTTQWNQGAPYNDLCPVVAGSTSVTGCVATAMAQLMNYHQWPEQGVGEYGYSWVKDDVTYTTSANFGATTYDWTNMRNRHNVGNPEQNLAVATLMSHCGVSVDMGYSPSSSGAQSWKVARSLLAYFDYDPEVRYVDRGWYTSSEWADLIYSELADGRPVYLSGNTGTGGHAFVCDGFSHNEYFHINWGWAGSSDGFFLLSDLNPKNQGIGGNSSGVGYKFSQGAIIGIQPPVEGHEVVPAMYLAASLSTTQDLYARSSDVNVEFNCGIYSRTTATHQFKLGFKLIYPDGTESIIHTTNTGDLRSNYGWKPLRVRSTNFPEGSYRVVPVFADANTDWQEMYYNKALWNNSLKFDVTADAIVISPHEDFDPVIDATLESYTSSTTSDSELVSGHTCTFNYRLDANAATGRDLYCVLLDASDAVVAQSATKPVDFNEPNTIYQSWPVKLPAAGEYRVALCYDELDYRVFINSIYTIKVVSTNPTSSISASYQSQSYINSRDKGIYVGHEHTFTYKATANGHWAGNLYLILQPSTGTTITAIADVQYVDLNSTNSIYTWTFRIPDSVTPGTYRLAIATRSGNSYTRISTRSVTISNAPAVSLTSIAMSGAAVSGTSRTKPFVMDVAKAQIAMSLKCTVGPWSDNVYFMVVDPATGNEVTRLAAQDTQIADGATKSVSFDIPHGDLAYDKAYEFIPFGEAHGCLGDGQFLTLDSKSGIDAVGEDGQSAEWYTLQGIRLSAEPTAPGCYLKVTRRGVEKITL